MKASLFFEKKKAFMKTCFSLIGLFMSRKANQGKTSSQQGTILDKSFPVKVS
jgi:hypothetical protein